MRAVSILFVTMTVAAGCDEEQFDSLNVRGLPSGGQAPFALEVDPPGEALPETLTYRELPETSFTDLVRDNTNLALDLMRLSASDDANWIMSPFSLLDGLAQLELAAANDFLEELRTAMRFPDDSERLHFALDSLTRQLDDDPGDGARLTVVRQSFVREDAELVPDYIDALGGVYGMRLRTLPLGGDPVGSVGQVNEWISLASDDLINDLFGADDFRGAHLVTVSVLAFSADWKTAMVPLELADEVDFQLFDGSTVRVPSLEADEELAAGTARVVYAEDYSAIVVDLAESPFKLLVLKPDDLRAFEPGMDAETVERVLAEAEPTQRPYLLLPLSLSASLSEDELTPLDFRGFTDISRGVLNTGPAPLRTRIRHQVVLEIDEEGLLGAAATGTVSFNQSMPIRSFRFDRPSYLMVLHEPTAAVIFLARVVTPE